MRAAESDVSRAAIPRASKFALRWGLGPVGVRWGRHLILGSLAPIRVAAGHLALLPLRRSLAKGFEVETAQLPYCCPEKGRSVVVVRLPGVIWPWIPHPVPVRLRAEPIVRVPRIPSRIAVIQTSRRQDERPAGLDRQARQSCVQREGSPRRSRRALSLDAPSMKRWHNIARARQEGSPGSRGGATTSPRRGLASPWRIRLARKGRVYPEMRQSGSERWVWSEFHEGQRRQDAIGVGPSTDVERVEDDLPGSARKALILLRLF